MRLLCVVCTFLLILISNVSAQELTPQARFASILGRLLPNTFARLVALSNRVLPGPTYPLGSEAWPGSESRPRKLPRLVTALGDRAALRNNEVLAGHYNYP